MTTGNIVSNNQTQVASGYLGSYFSKVWSGGDREESSRPTAPVPVPSFHEYASDLNLLQISRGRRLPYLKGAYDHWRTAREAYFDQLKSYHKAKADWIRTSKSEMHPYNCTISSIRHGQGSYWNKVGKWGSHGEVSLSGSFGWYHESAPWDNNDEIALINKIQAQLDGGVGFHLGIAVAEADRTFRMIGDNAKRFRRIGESLASGNMNKALRVAFNGSSANHIKGFKGVRGVADNYLLYQFGVKPLIHDVSDAARSYGYKAGRAKKTRICVEREAKHSGPGPQHGYWTQSFTSSMAQSIICYVSSDNVTDEAGLFDIPSIVWERIPYSFVVDWWFGVGKYLEALHTSRMISNTTFCRTTTSRITCGPVQSGSVYDITGFGGSSFYLMQKREVSNNLSVPPPVMKPILHKDSSVQLRHTLEAISLVVQKGPAIKRGYKNLAKARSVYTE